MEPFYNYLNELTGKNKKQFDEFPQIKWLNSSSALKAQKKKDLFSTGLSWLHKRTKPYYNHISSGCKLCGEGTWSCLFITNKCNAHCFYCPASQEKDEIPATQSLTFNNPESYAEYINYFGFKGISFSGGEPLLFFDRTLQYLKTIRKNCHPDIYIWMYTNGILASKEKFYQLSEAGLNEVRFDIGATGYKLDKVKLASSFIPNITIEIPAVPEKKELLKNNLQEFESAGVTNLNLHQLRLTRYNAPKLIKHNYTYISAEHPVVLESELTALEIADKAQSAKINMGVNYCSFFYKNRYQSTGFRKLLAQALNLPDDTITEKGYIRNFNGNSISYSALVLSENTDGNDYLHKLQFADKICYIKQVTAMPLLKLSPEQAKEVKLLINNEPENIPAKEYLFKIWQMEYIEKGIRDY